MVSKFQWKPFWLATQRDPENDWTATQKRVKYDVFAQAPLAMNLHFPLPKFAQLAMSSHFPLPKFRTFRFSLHNCRLSLQWEVTIVALKFATRSHFPLLKIFSRPLVPPLSNGKSRATSDRKPKAHDQILPSPILFFPSKKWIKLIPKTIGNRKRDCAWGGSGW